MAKRKNSKKQSQGVIYLIVLACLALICREPIAHALQDKLPVIKERITQKATPAITGSPLLPAPLKNVPEQILHRKGYITSYNREHKIPNWVAWELTPEKLIERESRTDKFLPDPDLPENHNLNRGDWKELEDACRLWTKKEGKLYIVCGPVLYRQKHRTIGRKHKVTVPEAFFKVILSTRNGHPKAIGFIFKNLSGNHPLKNYVNSVDEVERITGIDFFPALPDDVEKKVEAMQDLNLWSFR